MKSAARAWDVIETIEQLAPSSHARDGGLSVTTSPVVGGGQATETYPKRYNLRDVALQIRRSAKISADDL